MEHRIIAIGRKFGSGGHEVGMRAAQQLGIAFYDKELVALAAERGELNREKLEAFDEYPENRFLYEAVYEGNQRVPKGQSYSAVLFKLQSEVIRSISRREDAVIIGRCADHILRNRSNVKLMTAFITAPFCPRVERKQELEHLDYKKAEALVRKTDKMRSRYYRTYTGQPWGSQERFDLYLDAHDLGIEETVTQVVSAFLR